MRADAGEAVAQEIRVRLAAAEDLPQMEALYEAWKYTGRVAPGDTIVVADRKGGIFASSTEGSDSRHMQRGQRF